jgi:hypothetical protein
MRHSGFALYPQHQVRSFGSRKIGKAIDTAVLANPVSCVDVIGMHLFGKPGAEGLFRCEEALLRLGYFVKAASRPFMHLRIIESKHW